MIDGGSRVVILGIGNVLLGDEGVGVHVIRQLETQAEPLPPGVVPVDGGTLGIELLPVVQDAVALILVDAVSIGSEPGSVQTFRGEEIETRLSRHVSPHQVGSADLIGVARLLGVLPRQTALVGIQPERIAFDLELSAPVRNALSGAIRAVRELAEEFCQEHIHA